ncbi:hypothetical protein C8R44DRAFT_755833 [Mycena epipterygia]|nr:hypothetical protein C8R44DRAFT_755833 [Mycena epipterygia]
MNSLSSDFLLVSYVHVACLALLTYDTLLNVGQEYQHVWKSKWSLIKCLYLWTRYSTFIDTILATQERLNGNFSPSSCSIITNFNTVFSGIGIGIAEIILMVRTYAIYGRSKILLTFFLIMLSAIGVVNIWVVIKWTESFQVEVAPSCNIRDSSNIGFVCYASLLAGETVIVVLTLWKALHTFSLSRSSRLVTSFYYDGIFFYLAMLLIFIVEVVVQIHARSALKFIADTPLRVTHTIFVCHLVTHVRAVASEQESNMTAATSSLVFANFPAGSRRGVDTVV